MAAILIVDDEVPIRQALRRFLEGRKHTVFEAVDGVEALDVLGRNVIQLAFVDIMMPRMDGLELMSRMRREHANVKVIVVSAFDEVTDLAQREKDVVTTLKKPFELTDVAKAVALALGDN